MSDVQKDTEDLKEVTRAAHEAIKDCRLVVKSMTTVREELLSLSEEVFDERMDAQVKASLDEYKSAMAENIDNATQAVYDRFDTLARIMLGKGTDLDLEQIAARSLEK